MKERVVFLFLVTMGAIKVYENVGDEDAKDSEDKDDMYSSKKKNVGKRSVDELVDRWNLDEFQEELVEASNGADFKGYVECNKVLDDECTCRRLSCFGQMMCSRNENKSGTLKSSRERNSLNAPGAERFLRCRQTVIWGQTLCECKRFIRVKRNRRRKFVPISDDSDHDLRREDEKLNFVRSRGSPVLRKPESIAQTKDDTQPNLEKVKRLERVVRGRFDPVRLRGGAM